MFTHATEKWVSINEAFLHVLIKNWSINGCCPFRRIVSTSPQSTTLPRSMRQIWSPSARASRRSCVTTIAGIPRHPADLRDLCESPPGSGYQGHLMVRQAGGYRVRVRAHGARATRWRSPPDSSVTYFAETTHSGLPHDHK